MAYDGVWYGLRGGEGSDAADGGEGECMRWMVEARGSPCNAGGGTGRVGTGTNRAKREA